MDPDKYWVELLDIVYAHVVLWDSVPPCPAAICLWLSRLVEYEVSHFFPLRRLLGSDDSQEGIIETAGLCCFSEEQLDDWFSVFRVLHTEIRAHVRPYATISWVHSFPRYTVGLGHELAVYESVVVSALALEGGTRDSLGVQSMLGLLCEWGRCLTGGLPLVACLFLFMSDCTAVLCWNALLQCRPYIPWSCMSCRRLIALHTSSVLQFPGVTLLCALCLAVSTRILFVSWRAPFGVMIFVWLGHATPPRRPLLPMPPLMNPLLRSFILWPWSLQSTFLLSRELALPQLCTVAAGGALVVVRAVVAVTVAMVALFPAVPDRCFCSA
jgi:hypothetical protein